MGRPRDEGMRSNAEGVPSAANWGPGPRSRPLRPAFGPLAAREPAPASHPRRPTSASSRVGRGRFCKSHARRARSDVRYAPCCGLRRRRNIEAPTPAKPLPSNSSVLGSGTGCAPLPCAPPPGGELPADARSGDEATEASSTVPGGAPALDAPSLPRSGSSTSVSNPLIGSCGPSVLASTVRVRPSEHEDIRRQAAASERGTRDCMPTPSQQPDHVPARQEGHRSGRGVLLLCRNGIRRASRMPADRQRR